MKCVTLSLFFLIITYWTGIKTESLNCAANAILNNFDEIIVIAMPQRKYYMTDWLHQMGLSDESITWFDAIPGNSLDEQTLRDTGVLTANITKKSMHRMNTIGCYLSHYFVISDIYHRNVSKALVFEDDLMATSLSTFCDDFNEIMYQLDNQIGADNWDLINFGSVNAPHHPHRTHITSRIISGFDQFMHSYGISHNGAEKLIESDLLLPIDMYDIDWKISTIIDTKKLIPDFKKYAAYPRVFKQNRGELGSFLDQNRNNMRTLHF